MQVASSRDELVRIDGRDLVDWAVRYVAEALAIDRVVFFELRPTGDTLVLRAAVGWPDAMLGQATLPRERDVLFNHALTLAGPCLVKDVGTLSQVERELLLSGPTQGSAILMPIRSGGRPLGVLGVFIATCRPFSPDEVAVVAAVADMLESLEKHPVGVVRRADRRPRPRRGR
jgi:GAF domain-containing protein